MDGTDRKRRRSVIGGIISLVDFVSKHDKAITFDLLTKTRFSLDDVGGELSWFALSSFIQNLDSDSALARELKKSTGWENTLQTNVILADIYDLLQAINLNLCAIGGSKQHKKVKPYPRPFGKGDDNKRKIGKDPLPFNQLKEWIKGKQDNGKRN